ncbi:MAG TPA: carbonic anhydrase, partial [Planctomycetota bacterium]|nr:carbonic anhydrase [Planctomycetota bacterium]
MKDAPARERTISFLPVHTPDDILPEHRGTPVGDLLRYHNLGQEHSTYARAELLIGMCMDHRNVLCIPDRFAYVLRAGGANLQRIEFKVSFAIAIGGVKALALIGHDECGMMDLRSRRDDFVRGLVERAGWSEADAQAHFDKNADVFEID